MELNTTVKATITANATKQLELSRANDPLNQTRTLNLASGIGAMQANQSWHDQRTLSAGQFEDLDLSGDLLNAFGDPAAMTSLKAICIENLSVSDSLLVGAAPSDPVASLFGQVTHSLRIRPGGLVLLAAPDAAGYAVTPNAADQLRLTHSGDTQEPLSYKIVLIGITTI